MPGFTMIEVAPLEGAISYAIDAGRVIHRVDRVP